MTQHAADAFAHLQNLRNLSGHRDTVGLTDDVIQSFLSSDSTLGMAITEAVARRNHLKDEFGNDLLNLSESDLVKELQSDYINFYAPATVNPYVALAARGPWIVTAHGAVLHDNGGYGMLGAVATALKHDHFEAMSGELGDGQRHDSFLTATSALLNVSSENLATRVVFAPLPNLFA